MRIPEKGQSVISLTFPLKSFYIAAGFYLVGTVFHLLAREKPAIWFFTAGILINAVSEISGRVIVWPYCNMFEEPFFLPICVAAVSVVLIISGTAKDGLSLLPLIALFSLVAVFFSEGYYPPFTMQSKSIHAHLFHLFAFVGHGCLITGAYLAVCSLVRKRRDGIPYQMIIWGFAFMSVSGMFGMLWSYAGRSDTVSWNHYYFHSIAVWLYYAGFLHLHLFKGWDQNKKIWILVGGAVMILSLDYLPQIGAMHIPRVFNGGLYDLF